MKRFFKPLLLSVLLVVGVTTFAQETLRFGHINSQQILRDMPERAEAQKELQEEAEKLQEQFEFMQMEYQQKLQNFTENQDTMTSLVKQMRQRELSDIQARIQEFSSTAQEDLQRREMELLQPIFNKIENAITRVAEEQGLIYVFDLSGNSLLYHSNQSVNIQQYVREELGMF